MLSRNYIVAAALAAALVMFLGCSGGSTPLTPDPDPPDLTNSPDRPQSTISHNSWGIFEIKIDAHSATAEVTPLRTAFWHLNTIPFLEKSGISTIKLDDLLIDGSSVELNVGLVHPFPGLLQWSGFDVRGIFIADGTWNEFASDGDLVTSEPDEPRLLNADGWTRWWNQEEFPSNGTILGYVPGIYGPNYAFANTLNPYKYYADDLSQNDTFPDDLDLNRRGIFTANSTINRRHYSLDFGTPANYYIFNYAVDACHMFDPGYDGESIPSPADLPDPFFPIGANMPEPFAITVDAKINTLYWADEINFGGDIVLEINVYDWQGMKNAEGIPGEIEEFRIESPNLKGTEVITSATVYGDDPNYSTYMVELLECHPDSQFNQDILVTLVSKDGYYSEGYDSYDTTYTGPNGDRAAAFYLYTPAVSPEIPVQEDLITVLLPDGGEVWNVGSSYNIQWYSSGSITNVDIEFSKNSDLGPWAALPGALNIPNTGSWSWGPLPGDVTTMGRIRISDSSNPVTNDISDADFEVYDPTNLTITSPNGGEVWVSGEQNDITWTSGGPINFVKIDYSTNNGGNWIEITATTDNDGSYEFWDTASLASDEMLVRIYDAADLDPWDQSDAAFTIESLSLTYPNAATHDFTVGTSGQYIQWTIGSGTTDTIQNIRIEFSKNGGSTWPYTLVSSTPAGTGQWEWVPTTTHITTQGRIRITDVNHSQLTDTSDANFEVMEVHELTLLEYRSWFQGAPYTYRGRTTNLNGLSHSQYDGTVTSWDFTSAPLSTYIGGGNFTVTTAQGTSIPEAYPPTPNWYSNDWGFQCSINGPAGHRPWWVFNFNTSTNRLYYRGSTDYVDLDFTQDGFGFCTNTVVVDMTHHFDTVTATQIQFPLDEFSSTETFIGNYGDMYYMHKDMFSCVQSLRQYDVVYQTGSEWEVIAFGDVTVPHSGGTNYPNCLLVKYRGEYESTSPGSIIFCHDGQLMYQWIDTDSGMVVAFMYSHNQPGYPPYCPQFYGYTGEYFTSSGIIGAYN